MQGMVGANVQQLEELAQRMGAAAQRLTTVTNLANGRLRTAEWRGGDVDQLRGRWESQIRPALNRAQADLEEASRVLRANAQAQRATSNDTGGPKGAGVIGGPGTGGPGTGGSGGGGGGGGVWGNDNEQEHLPGVDGPSSNPQWSPYRDFDGNWQESSSGDGTRTDTEAFSSEANNYREEHNISRETTWNTADGLPKPGESPLTGEQKNPFEDEHHTLSITEDVTLAEGFAGYKEGVGTDGEFWGGQGTSYAEAGVMLGAGGTVTGWAGMKDGALGAGISAKGEVGASVTGAAGVDVGWGSASVEGEAFVGARGEADLGVSVGPDGISAKAGVSVEAGFVAEASGTVEVMGVSATGGAEFVAGVKFEAQVGASFSADEVGLSMDLSAALGIGGGFSFDVSVSPADVASSISEYGDDIADWAGDVGSNISDTASDIGSFLNPWD